MAVTSVGISDNDVMYAGNGIRGCIVTGTVIYDDDLVSRECLLENTVNSSPDMLADIVSRDHNAYLKLILNL